MTAQDERGLRDLGRREWLAVLGRAVVDMADDAAPLLSAGVAFYMFLSIFPGLLAALTLYGLVADPGQLESQVRSVLSAVPGDARGVLVERVHALVLASSSGVSPRLGLAIVGALWTSSLGVTGLLKAVKIAYDEEEERNFLQLRSTGVLLTAGAIAFLVAAVGLLAVLPAALRTLGLGGVSWVVVQVLRWLAVGGLALIALASVYHLGADRGGSHPKWTGPGTVVAAALWTGMNAAFSWYAGGVEDYGSTYGAITGGVVLLLWLFLTSLVILFGAEVNAEAERQARGTVRPRRREASWETAAAWWRRRRAPLPAQVDAE